ncbi:uncharacterized protein DUF3237 [Homoserinimonas aerilata]|uniref:Uncharacterized protein DUF3237 n=1 Tax=Homoserinimonas aerilata TaxID=1162970 RepID=A0A542YH94_9MICO|nr:DUF3237 domain-containing protein [Homoserinimonas aerilata]TQL47462.1 uncharacterized protein DUF3237 [Homoserinimonas aerilata]
MTSNPRLGLELIARIRVDITEPIEAGEVIGGHRRIIPISGGVASGPRITGDVLPLGADWNLRAHDGRETASARYVVRTTDGALLSIYNEGVLCGVGGSFSGITRPQIEAPDGDYAWLNDAVLSGTLSIVTADGAVTGVALEFWQAVVAQ